MAEFCNSDFVVIGAKARRDTGVVDPMIASAKFHAKELIFYRSKVLKHPGKYAMIRFIDFCKEGRGI